MLKCPVCIVLILLLGNSTRSDEVRRVTNLNDSGPGSLRSVLLEDGPARITFAVSGEIRLESPIEWRGTHLSVSAADVPSPGITLLGFGLKITGSHAQLEHVRIAVGDYHNDPNDSPEQDGILIQGSSSEPLEDVKIRNCTIIAAVDEGIATYGPVSHIDVSRCIIAFGLSKSHHQDVVSAENPETAHHSMAILVSSEATEIRFAQNLIALNRHRNPRIMPGSSVGFVNNVVYGWGSSIDDGLNFAARSDDERPIQIAFLGNYYQGLEGSYLGKSKKRDSRKRPQEQELSSTPYDNIGSIFRCSHAKNFSVWDKGNVVLSATGEERPYNQEPAEFVSDMEIAPREASFASLLPSHVLAAEDAYSTVLEHAGAHPGNRHTLDNQIVTSVQSKKGAFIDSFKDFIPH